MTLHLDIVSAEAEIYSGRAERVFASGTLGELEVAPGHAPLLTSLLPGPLRIREQGGKEHVIYVTGGVLEVQPQIATILADTVVRAKDFNEAEALKAKQEAEEALKDKKASMDYAKARAELIRAAGMLKAIEKMKKRKQ
ncbi:MAG TPA: F0F1 ATP synthase subunit epsilon [Gammaproteobacteria bacterium]|nr:F0F1 ATP synthase subunit epsilon [Gammaproteobacteria bacterium]